MKNKKYILMLTVLLLILFSAVALARTPTGPPDPAEVELIERWDNLPFKNQRFNKTYVDELVDSGTVDWSKFSDAEKTSLKCLSYSASTVNDWFNNRPIDL